MISRIVAAIFALVISATVGFAADTYTVKPGNNLAWIAKQHNVAREAMIIANEQYLQKQYGLICKHRSEKFRNRTVNKGRLKGGLHFCNDRFYRAFANTLKPGMKLTIPVAVAPASIEQTVTEIQGNKITLVIDDTGSMSNKRKEIARSYLAAMHRQQKIHSVYLFADGGVRKVEKAGVRELEKELKTDGNFENTYKALKEAALGNPDAIILVTDERGDDWPSNFADVKTLPPIVAHCLPLSDGRLDCKKTLTELVHVVGKGSRYVEGIDALTASR